MFDRQHPGRKFCRRIVRHDRYPALDDPRAAIEVLGYKMHRTAVPRFAAVDGALMRIETGKLRQQRWVYVQHPSAEMVDEGAGQDAHEAGQDDEFRLEAIQGFDQRGVE